MRILGLALAHPAQRFVEGFPPRGSRLFLHPNVELSRVAALCDVDDCYEYRDTRVDRVGPSDGFDIVLVHVDFGQEETAREVAVELSAVGDKTLFFGPLVTSWGQQPPPWLTHRVVGDITGVWHRVKSDLAAGRLEPVYHSDASPGYAAARWGIHNGRLNRRYQAVHFVRGCFCPAETRSLCPEYLYYKDTVTCRSRDEIVGEVLSLPHKHINLLDDDVASLPDYYVDLFQRLWNYRRHWTVNASVQILRYPRLTRLLAQAGTRIVTLNETFLMHEVGRATEDTRLRRRFRRGVKSLQSNRMLVGARVPLAEETVDRYGFAAIAAVLARIGLDFVELKQLSTGPDGTVRAVPVIYDPARRGPDVSLVKSRFYSLGAIMERLARRPRRVGFYNTAMYLLPYSAAFRQNTLEGLPSP